MVEETCGFLPEVRHVKTFAQTLSTLREAKDGMLMVDSVSALADREASYCLSRTPEPRAEGSGARRRFCQSQRCPIGGSRNGRRLLARAFNSGHQYGLGALYEVE